MLRKIFNPRIALFLIAATFLATATPPAPRVAVAATAAAATNFAAPVAAQGANIGVNGFFSTDKAQRGGSVQAAVVLDIPHGFHVNSNRAAKFSIPTVVKVDVPRGLRVGAVAYPRAVVRRLSFSKEPLSLYEGRAVMRFNISVPANFQTGLTELRAKVTYQSCNDEVCFPPTTREVKLGINVVGANESVKRINGQYFGRKG
ncbi:MAG TPA: protein-disulfide reductase DsbD domain-containing protein [Pyrinomonadaceae bacterium]|jgi:thiol:disulfide interchange protein DsbD|nr:protein-disulfide reductase DsbD domain-containing protein [Pyrinomonadaceae bacterium]